MAFSDGDLFVDGSIFSFQQANRMLTNFRAASVPSNAQPGSLFSDSDDDKLYHEGAAASEEILQLTRSRDVDPEFKDIITKGINLLCVDEGVLIYEGNALTYGYN